MTSEPAVTVIVPVRNHAEIIRPCLKALLKSTAAAGMEILVVDMGSGDGTEEIVRTLWDNRKKQENTSGQKSPERTAALRFFETGGNTGRCHALNSGLLLTRTPYAAVVFPELEVGRHCLERLRAALEEDPDAFCACSDGEVRMYRMAALEQTKWFDERLYKGLEAEDLEWRAALCGYRSVYVRNAWVRRLQGKEARSLTDISIEAGNFLYLVYKNLPGLQQTLNQPFLRTVLKKYRRYLAGQGREDLYEAAMERAEDLCMDAEMTLARSEEGLGPVGLPLPGVFCLEVQDGRTENIYPLYTGLRAETSWQDFPVLAGIQAAMMRRFLKIV